MPPVARSPVPPELAGVPPLLPLLPVCAPVESDGCAVVAGSFDEPQPNAKRHAQRCGRATRRRLVRSWGWRRVGVRMSSARLLDSRRTAAVAPIVGLSNYLADANRSRARWCKNAQRSPGKAAEAVLSPERAQRVVQHAAHLQQIYAIINCRHSCYSQLFARRCTDAISGMKSTLQRARARRVPLELVLLGAELGRFVAFGRGARAPANITLLSSLRSCWRSDDFSSLSTRSSC